MANDEPDATPIPTPPLSSAQPVAPVAQNPPLFSWGQAILLAATLVVIAIISFGPGSHSSMSLAGDTSASMQCSTLASLRGDSFSGSGSREELDRAYERMVNHCNNERSAKQNQVVVTGVVGLALLTVVSSRRKQI